MTLAAAFGNIKLSWVKGIQGSEVSSPLSIGYVLARLRMQVDDITMPRRLHQIPPVKATKGSWRAHLNAIHT